MSARKHARAIIATARREIMETNAADPLGNLWTDEELLEWANEGQDMLVSQIVAMDGDFFGDHFDINAVAGVSIYDLPARFVRMRQVEYVAGGGRVPVLEARVTQSSPAVLSAAVQDANVAPFAFALYNDQIHIDPAPAQAGSPTFRCWFEGDACELTYGKATAGSGSSITLQAVDTADGFAAHGDDGYYNLAWIVITAGVGAGQRRRISEYDGDTKIAIVAQPWTVTPDTTSLYATETKIPLPIWRMVPLFAAIAAKGKYKQDARALAARYNALEESIPEALEARTSTQGGVEPFDSYDGVYPGSFP